jgi:hypothetical protein
MNAKTETPIAYSNERLIEFFDKQISPETMAKYIRRINYILTLTVIRSSETTNPMNLEWLDDGFYHLNELAEILEPNLFID